MADEPDNPFLPAQPLKGVDHGVQQVIIQRPEALIQEEKLQRALSLQLYMIGQRPSDV